MALKLVVLLLLGLTSSIGSSDSEVLKRTKDVAPNQIVCPSNTTTDSPLNVTAIIRFIVKDDMERYQSVLNMARKARTLEMTNSIIKAVAVDFESSNADPVVILDFYKQIKYDFTISSDEVYQALVNHSVRILAESIHSNKPGYEFPMVSNLLFRLREGPHYYLENILEALFDIVLSSESPLKVAQRLHDLDTNLEERTVANLLLLNRCEMKTNSSEHAGLQDNLQKLAANSDFGYVPIYLRRKVIRMFPHFFDWLPHSIHTCIRQAYNNKDYLKFCYDGDTIYMCTNQYSCSRCRVRYNVNHRGSAITFESSTRYLGLSSTIQTGGRIPKVSRNLFGMNQIFWWRLVPVPNGVALYDDETTSLVICGGDPKLWDGNKHYAYTRRAEDFETYREECTWLVDDCGI